jgi:hypothetical protein
MKSLINHETDAEQLLGTASLEMLRNRALEKISKDESLSEQQKTMAVRELDFLLEYERLRRLRQAAWQWRDEKRERRYRNAIKKQQVFNQMMLDQKSTDLEIAEINRKIIRIKLDVMTELRKLKPKPTQNADIKKARNEMLKLKIRSKMARAMQRDFAEGISDLALYRARFLKKVQEEFPDSADLIIDNFDQLLNQFMERRR